MAVVRTHRTIDEYTLDVTHHTMVRSRHAPMDNPREPANTGVALRV